MDHCTPEWLSDKLAMGDEPGGVMACGDEDVIRALMADAKPGEWVEIPRDVQARVEARIAERTRPKIEAMRRAQAEAYERIRHMVIF